MLTSVSLVATDQRDSQRLQVAWNQFDSGYIHNFRQEDYGRLPV